MFMKSTNIEKLKTSVVTSCVLVSIPIIKVASFQYERKLLCICHQFLWYNDHRGYPDARCFFDSERKQ